MAKSYIRRELGGGQVKFIVLSVKPATLVVPAGAGLLFVFVISRLFPWLPWILAVGGGGFLFYWLRNRIQQRVEKGSGFFIASPTELVIRGQTIPRASIQEVIWRDFTPDHIDLEKQPHHDIHSSLYVHTVSGESIILGGGIGAGAAAQLASDLGRTLGVSVSGGRARPFGSTATD